MGGGAGTRNGTGMVAVASDGSLLVTQMGMTMMGSPGASGSPSLQRAIVSVSSTGQQRWRATFSQGWPMMAASHGDLVAVVVVRHTTNSGSNQEAFRFGY